MLEQGMKAPAFALLDQEGVEHRLTDQKGKWVLLYFYPKDDTPGCTKEACGIRDQWGDFKKMGVSVFGVSADSVAKHKKFVEKYTLPFTLLADEEKELVKAYGVWGQKKFMGREYLGIHRVSFLIDPEGKIAKVYPKVKAAVHAQEVLNDLKELMV
jgi:thioredoxin-dependent peroxiredoxin